MNLINQWLPWVLEGIYVVMALANFGGNIGPFMYWLGAAILNMGVILMSNGGSI